MYLPTLQGVLAILVGCMEASLVLWRFISMLPSTSMPMIPSTFSHADRSLGYLLPGDACSWLLPILKFQLVPIFTGFMKVSLDEQMFLILVTSTYQSFLVSGACVLFRSQRLSTLRP